MKNLKNLPVFIKQARQGDVLIEFVNAGDRSPSGKEITPVNGRLELAQGEVTGHAHAIPIRSLAEQGLIGEKDFIKMYDEGEGKNEKGGLRYKMLCVKTEDGGGVPLTHEEHNHFWVEDGNYFITQQREYHPDELRNVTD